LTVITDPAQITTEWLEATLASRNTSSRVRLRGFSATSEGSTFARIVRLRLDYEEGDSATVTAPQPRDLLLKLCTVGNTGFGASEVDYYVRDYANAPNRSDLPIPTCYDAAYDPTIGAYHILMDDLSATHQPSWEVTPTLDYALALADGLAALHAQWWGASGLAAGGFAVPTSQALEAYLDHNRPGLQPLLNEMGGTLDPSAQDALHEVFAQHPRVLHERIADHAGFTLVHGDLNPGNILSPQNGTGRCYFIDRQPFEWSLTTWLGVSDLTYATVHWWEPAHRHQFALPMLRRYHASLQSHGVDNYSWDQLWVDCHLCAVQSLYIAVEWCTVEADIKRMKWVWEPQLRRALAAYFDLACYKLWR
jgi:hypothetical protein